MEKRKQGVTFGINMVVKASNLKQKRVPIKEEKSEVNIETPLRHSASLGNYAVNHVVNIDGSDNNQSPNENELTLIHSKGDEHSVDEEEKCEVDVEAPLNRLLSLENYALNDVVNIDESDNQQ